ncbi:MAG: cytochrome c [Pseudomonadota bacterium]
MRKAVGALTGALATIWLGQALAADSPKSLVEYRQAVMKSIGASTGAIGMIVKGEVSYTDQIPEHADAILEMSLLVPKIFPPNSTYDDYNKTDALPAIWKEPEKFKTAVEDFQKAAAHFAETAQGSDMDATTNAYLELGKTCGGCHKPFRHKE